MNYEPCLPVVSILTHRPGQLGQAVDQLDEHWSSMTLTAPCFVFDETDYYQDEMGYPLLRWWGYRDRLSDPSNLTEWKQICSGVEDECRDNRGNRPVNIDPGYLNYGLLVLASNKYDLQKIYLGDDVYADPVLQYGDGGFQSFPWSFPDFKKETYYKLLEDLRDRYCQLRNSG